MGIRKVVQHILVFVMRVIYLYTFQSRFALRFSVLLFYRYDQGPYTVYNKQKQRKGVQTAVMDRYRFLLSNLRAYRLSDYLGGYLLYDLFYYGHVPSGPTSCLPIPLQS